MDLPHPLVLAVTQTFSRTEPKLKQVLFDEKHSFITKLNKQLHTYMIYWKNVDRCLIVTYKNHKTTTKYFKHSQETDQSTENG